MIIAAGLTPAWQQIMCFDQLRAGEVNRATAVQWCASGKVLNVGLALAHLGVESETIALVGGTTGGEIAREFAALGAPAHWVQSAHPTRICTTLLEAETGRTTELVENAGPASQAELDAFLSAYAARVHSANVSVLTGSLPIGAPATFFHDLLGVTPCPVILDMALPGASPTAPIRSIRCGWGSPRQSKTSARCCLLVSIRRPFAAERLRYSSSGSTDRLPPFDLLFLWEFPRKTHAFLAPHWLSRPT